VVECRNAASQSFSVPVPACQGKGRDRARVRVKMLSEPTVRRFVRVNAGVRTLRALDLPGAVRRLDQAEA